jgi:hypothetical protein
MSARVRALVLASLVMMTCDGCTAFAPPKPWEKDQLARPAMQLDPDPLEARVQQQIYTSKEAAAGGTGVGGGGCGCN